MARQYLSGCPFGSHRSLEPPGSLPQPAWKLDNRPEAYDNEILIDVETLNIDAASFTQMESAAAAEAMAPDSTGLARSEAAHGGPDESVAPPRAVQAPAASPPVTQPPTAPYPAAQQPVPRARIAAGVARMITDTVARRGKMHNPVTGSGGVLTGMVLDVGPRHPDFGRTRPGDRIATLVSLSLTPLMLEEVKSVSLETDQVQVRGKAILFASGIYAQLPADIPEHLALAVLDVAGAPAQTARLVRPGDIVLVIGAGGKSGLLCMYEARRRAGVTGKVIGLAHSNASRDRAARTGYADVVLQGDATAPLEVLELVHEAAGGALADVTINCVNIPGTEMASILCTRDGGTIYFFSMATSFTAAALGAEGVGRDVTMIVGNGYAAGHAQIALSCLRESRALREQFETQFGRPLADHTSPDKP